MLLDSGGHGINAVIMFPMAALPVVRFPCLFWQTLRQMSECFGLFLINQTVTLAHCDGQQNNDLFMPLFFFVSP